MDPSSCRRRKLTVHVLSNEEHSYDSEYNNHDEKVSIYIHNL